jgi:hypothetical protein
VRRDSRESQLVRTAGSCNNIVYTWTESMLEGTCELLSQWVSLDTSRSVVIPTFKSVTSARWHAC